jgi:hypothetical protein
MPDESKQLKEINPQDVEAVTEKLKEWVPTLPEQEQLVMGWVLTRAAAAGDEEVSGHALPIKTIGPVPIWTFRW